MNFIKKLFNKKKEIPQYYFGAIRDSYDDRDLLIKYVNGRKYITRLKDDRNE